MVIDRTVRGLLHSTRGGRHYDLGATVLQIRITYVVVSSSLSLLLVQIETVSREWAFDGLISLSSCHYSISAPPAGGCWQCRATVLRGANKFHPASKFLLLIYMKCNDNLAWMTNYRNHLKVAQVPLIQGSFFMRKYAGTHWLTFNNYYTNNRYVESIRVAHAGCGLSAHSCYYYSLFLFCLASIIIILFLIVIIFLTQANFSTIVFFCNKLYYI